MRRWRAAPAPRRARPAACGARSLPAPAPRGRRRHDRRARGLDVERARRVARQQCGRQRRQREARRRHRAACRMGERGRGARRTVQRRGGCRRRAHKARATRTAPPPRAPRPCAAVQRVPRPRPHHLGAASWYRWPSAVRAWARSEAARGRGVVGPAGRWRRGQWGLRKRECVSSGSAYGCSRGLSRHGRPEFDRLGAESEPATSRDARHSPPKRFQGLPVAPGSGREARALGFVPRGPLSPLPPAAPAARARPMERAVEAPAGAPGGEASDRPAPGAPDAPPPAAPDAGGDAAAPEAHGAAPSGREQARQTLQHSLEGGAVLGAGRGRVREGCWAGGGEEERWPTPTPEGAHSAPRPFCLPATPAIKLGSLRLAAMIKARAAAVAEGAAAAGGGAGAAGASPAAGEAGAAATTERAMARLRATATEWVARGARDGSPAARRPGPRAHAAAPPSAHTPLSPGGSLPIHTRPPAQPDRPAGSAASRATRAAASSRRRRRASSASPSATRCWRSARASPTCRSSCSRAAPRSWRAAASRRAASSRRRRRWTRWSACRRPWVRRPRGGRRRRGGRRGAGWSAWAEAGRTPPRPRPAPPYAPAPRLPPPRLSRPPARPHPAVDVAPRHRRPAQGLSAGWVRGRAGGARARAHAAGGRALCGVNRRLILGPAAPATPPRPPGAAADLPPAARLDRRRGGAQVRP
jgi:hypothetical protein